MELVPDFSGSKILIKNRIEGAIREKKKKPSLYQYSFFFCMFLFTSICTALYLRTFTISSNNMIAENSDYFNIEQALRTERLESETIIEIPIKFSLMSPGESTLISNINFTKRNYE